MYCGTGTNSLNFDSLTNALDACISNHYIPVFVTNQPDKLPDKAKFFFHVVVCPAEVNYSPKSELDIVIPIFTLSKFHPGTTCSSSIDQCGVLIDTAPSLSSLQSALSTLESKYRLVSLIPASQDTASYLDKIAHNMDLSISIAIRPALLKRDCPAGSSSVAICPDGKLYACPAFYFNASKDALAIPVNSLDRYTEFFQPKFNCEKTPSCLNCKYANYIATGDIHGC